ncbi:MAG: chorismate synthase, partial [Bacilli bacterium]|nr:chorismate synthase [Bacilli bacterium]
MSSFYQGNLKITIFGESHSQAIGVVIDGLKAGLNIDFDQVNLELAKRKAYGDISTSRQERDELQILSGYWQNRTTGTPLTIIVTNQDIDSQQYEQNKDFLRPSHADYSAYLKYHGFQDYRGSGHFSGRLTVAIVIAGAI